MKGIIEDPTAMPDMGFGCAVTNRFDQLLDDEADPFDIIRGAQVDKQKKKKKDEPKRTVAAKSGKETPKDRKTPIAGNGDNSAQLKTSQAGQKQPPRGGSGHSEIRQEKPVALRERRFNDKEAPIGYSIERPLELADRGGRGRAGSRGRGVRGGGYGGFRSTDGFDQRGKREFERHSGSDRTGVRSEEKRGGSGPRNWGSMRDQMSAIVDVSPAEDGGDTEETPESGDTGGNRGPELEGAAAEEASVEMSLDEWKALQEQARPKKEFNIRKADTSVPSKAVVIHKSKHLEQEPGEEGSAEEDEAAPCRRPANDITAKLEINFGSLGRQSRGGRGGRGGGVEGSQAQDLKYLRSRSSLTWPRSRHQTLMTLRTSLLWPEGTTVG